MIEMENKTDLTIDEEILYKILDFLSVSKDIEMIVVDTAQMQEINKLHRNIDKPTDVLSFPYEDMPLSPLGSIVLCADIIIQKALEFNHSNQDETTLLFTHALLHLLGYDHEVDNGEMRAKEKEIIEHFNLPKSLIVRSEQ